MAELDAPAADRRSSELASSLAAARERVSAAERAAGRQPGSVTLLVVTKFFPAADMARLIALGADEFGESREPEAGRKVVEVRGELPDAKFDVDMIGSVQRKKVRSVSRWARRVHSVDSERLVEAFGTAASTALAEGERRDRLGVLLQVSLDGDPERGGVTADGLPALAESVLRHEALTLDGLMTIAPLSGSREAHMARLAEIRERFVGLFPQADVLSAGMSGDLEEAVEYGSTCVRVGTAIMGERPLLSQ